MLDIKQKQKQKGYWSDINNVNNDVIRIMRENKLDKFPTAKILNDIGESSLSNAIRKHGGSYYISSLLNIDCSERPKKYWKDIDNLNSEAIDLISKYGSLPTQKELTRMGLSSFTHAANEFYGGIDGLKKHFCIEVRNNPKGFWTKERIINDYFLLKDKIGYPPSYTELNNEYGSKYISAVSEIFNGVNKLKKSIGEEYEIKIGKEHWNDKDNIKTALDLLVSKLGVLPTFNDMNKNGYSNLRRYINKNFDSIHSFYDFMGLKYNDRKGHSYWKDKSNFEYELKRIINKYDTVPTTNTLASNGDSSFLNAAIKYHGGIAKIREDFSGVISKKDAGHWLKWGNVEKAILLIIDDIGLFPSWSDINFSNKLPVSALKYHGGIKEIRRRMGYSTKVRISRDGHENDSVAECLIDDMLFKYNIKHVRGKSINLFGKNVIPDFILDEKTVIEVLMVDYRKNIQGCREKSYVKRYLKKKELYEKSNIKVFEVFPSAFGSKKQFEKCVSLLIENISSIKIDDIDIDFFKPKHGFNYWSDINNLLSELTPICVKLGRFPSGKELKCMGVSYLVPQISRHGGVEKIAQILGVDCFKRAKQINKKKGGYWNDIENFRSELDLLIKKLGRFPLQREMGNALAVAISRRGGISKIKQEIGYSI